MKNFLLLLALLPIFSCCTLWKSSFVCSESRIRDRIQLHISPITHTTFIQDNNEIVLIAITDDVKTGILKECELDTLDVVDSSNNKVLKGGKLDLQSGNSVAQKILSERDRLELSLINIPFVPPSGIIRAHLYSSKYKGEGVWSEPWIYTTVKPEQNTHPFIVEKRGEGLIALHVINAPEGAKIVEVYLDGTNFGFFNLNDSIFLPESGNFLTLKWLDSEGKSRWPADGFSLKGQQQ